mgnify:FL=1
MSDAVITFPILGDGFSLSFKSYFKIFGFTFHWYGIIIAAGFLLAIFYAMKRCKQFGLTEDNIIDLLIFTVPLAIVGARAYYVIFSWSDYKDNPINVFKIWEGGLAIYGGVIGAVTGLIIFSKVKHIKIGPAADIGSLGLLIGQSIGRWGNFVNREAYGAKTNVPWRMGLTNEWGTFYYHPCFLYESLWNALGLLILHFYSKKRKFDGEVFFLYIAWYGLGRLFIEGLRTDSLYLFGSNLRVSQLVALLSIIGGLGAIAFIRINRHPEPDDLLVNSIAKAAEKPEEESEEDKVEELYDEDFASALELLRKGSTVAADDDSDSSDAIEEPVDASPSSDEDDLSDRKANE